MWNDTRARISWQAPPRHTRAVVREALLGRLDSAIEGPLTVVVAGQGFGKTCALCQLEESRGDLRFCWLRLDMLRVPPTPDGFMSGLAESVRAQYPSFGQGPYRLPHIQLGSASEVDGAAAAFTKELSTYALQRTLLVIEGFHVVDASGHISLLVSRLVEEAPESLGFVLTSRTSPRLPIPNLVARGKAQLLVEEDFRFGPMDVEAVLRREGCMGQMAGLRADILRASGGRASVVAGLVPALNEAPEQARSAILADWANAGHPHGLPMGRILDGLPQQSSDFLIRASILDTVDEAEATELSGNPAPRELLRACARAGHLEPIVEGDRVRYVWHPEALDVLASEREARLTTRALDDLRVRAARVYLERGDRTSAARMLLIASQTDEALTLLADELPALMRSLRIREAEELMSLIPQSVLMSDGGLLMLLGELRRRQGRLSEAMDAYERASGLAKALGDVGLRVEALHSLATTSLEVTGSEELRELAVAELEDIDSPDAAMNSSLVRSCMQFLAEDFPGAHRTALSAVVRATQDEVHYPDCLSFLISVGFARGEFREAEKLLAREVAVRRSRGEILGVSEMLGIGNSVWIVCGCLFALGDSDGLESLVSQILPSDGSPPAPEMVVVFRMVWALCAITRGDYDLALKRLQGCAALVTEEKRLNAFSFNDEASFMLRREFAHVYFALRDAGHARVCVYHNLESPLALLGRREYLMLAKTDLAEYLIVEGRPTEALAIVAETLAFQRQSGRAMDEMRSLALRARSLALTGSEGPALSCVLECLAIAAPRGLSYGVVGELRHQECLPLLAQVLVSTDAHEELRMFLEESLAIHAPTMLRRLQDGSPSSPATKPPSVRSEPDPTTASILFVRTFGGMHVVVDGRDASQWRKNKARVLFALLLSAEGRALSKDYVADLLWPEADPYDARNSLRNTVWALRGALGVTNGKIVQSSRDSVWLAYDRDIWDVPRFEDIVGIIRGLDVDGSATAHHLAAHLEHLKSIYAGDFLPEPVFGDLFTDRRHKYREDYCDCLCILADIEVGRRMYDTAIGCYRSALEADDCLERAHFGLMRALSGIGDREAAIRQYRACQERLRGVLGVTPERGTVEFFEAMVGVSGTPQLTARH